MKRLRRFLVAALSVLGTATVSAWMTMLNWAEGLPFYTEDVLGITVLFLVGVGFGFLIAVIFMRK